MPLRTALRSNSFSITSRIPFHKSRNGKTGQIFRFEICYMNVRPLQKSNHLSSFRAKRGNLSQSIQLYECHNEPTYAQQRCEGMYETIPSATFVAAARCKSPPDCLLNASDPLRPEGSHGFIHAPHRLMLRLIHSANCFPHTISLVSGKNHKSSLEILRVR